VLQSRSGTWKCERFTPLSGLTPDKPYAMGLLSPTSPGVDRAQILKTASSLGLMVLAYIADREIMAALCNSDVSPGEVESLVLGEPALYARVLRIANSAYYGQARSITTLSRAVVVLGLDAVRGIAARRVSTEPCLGAGSTRSST